MTTTAAVTSNNPLQVTVTTDQQMAEIKGNLTFVINNDTVPLNVDDKFIVHNLVVTDSTGHQWSVVSNDQGAPTSKIVLGY
jgi:hypothetical protein